MSPQADYVVANASGSAFRADLNNQLAAIVANNSGATEPATMYAFQWWADTTTGTLKLRNASNNAWVTIGTLASTNLGLLSLAGGTMTGALVAALGTSSVPGISFTGDLDTGLSAAAANTLVLSTNGTARLTASTTAVTSSLPIDVPLGSVGAPSLTFTGDLDTGILSPGANQLAIATNGVERVEFGTTEVVFNDGGADVDFRVEGDTKPNLFKVDAGADTVIIDGLTHPSADGSAGQSLVTNGSGVLSVASVPPPGSIFWFAANAAPAGYLKANGANVNRTTYAALFAAIGTTFGVGDGSTTFTLPDLRGEFARGWDDGRGIDSGRTFGSAQGHAFASHTHTYTASGASGNSVTGGPTPINDGGQTLNTGAQGAAAETRPRNIALLAIIKF
jgi:microcystin-dependent protein